MSAIDAFFSAQSSRVRGGKFFVGVESADAALAKAKQRMGQWSGKSGGFKYAASKLEKRQLDYTGRAFVAADEGAGRFAAGLIKLIGPSFEQAFETVVIPWARHVIDQWPVATGASRSALALEVDATDSGVVSIALVGGDPKTFFVAYSKGRDAQKESFERGVIRYLTTRIEHGGNGKQLEDGAQSAAAEQFKITIDQVRRIWYNRDTQRKVYRLPDGTDAKGAHAWSAQARKPFAPMVVKLASVTDARISRNAKAFTESSK